MRRQYLVPPIVKASCTCYFADKVHGWNHDAFSALHDAFRADYDGLPRIEPINSIAISLNAAEPASLLAAPEDLLIAFATADLTRAIIATQSSLSIQVRPPYDGWENFSLRISRAFTSWISVFSDTNIGSISVRYENEILQPAPISELNQYYNIQITPMSEDVRIYKALHAFAIIDENNSIVDVRLSSYPLPESQGSVSSLELDAATHLADPGLQMSRIFPAVQTLKASITSMFENIITDKVRETLVEL